MPVSLELKRKISLYAKVLRDGVVPQAPLVGERWIVCGADFTRMALLDRASLEVVARFDMPEFPLRWIGPERLLMSGPRTGLWDAAGQRFVWRMDRPGGGSAWRDRLVMFASDSELEIRLVTGEIERTIDLGSKGRGFTSLCGDFLLQKASGSGGDPVRAVHLADGRVQWTRDLLSEINRQRPAIIPKPAAAIVEGAIADRFIVTREGALASCSLIDGAILWTADVAAPYHWPLIVDGRIPVLCGGRFTVIDEATGALLIDRRHPELSEMFRERPGAILGDWAVFTSESTHLAAFDLRTGDLVCVRHDKRVGLLGTAVADGRLLAAGTDGNLWIYEAE